MAYFGYAPYPTSEFQACDASKSVRTKRTVVHSSSILRSQITMALVVRGQIGMAQHWGTPSPLNYLKL